MQKMTFGFDGHKEGEMRVKRVQVLLIGVGGYGRVYLDAMVHMQLDADIVGICEIMPDIRERFPCITERNLTVYTSVEDFYREHDADLAVISTPVHTHKELCLTCFSHKTNVLCEKPLCLTMEDVLFLKSAAEQSGCFLSLGYQLDYRRDILALKRDILHGLYGAPKCLGVMQAFRRGKAYYARNRWAGRITADGREVFDSPFANASAHNFQLMTFLLGDSMEACCDITGMEAELYRGNPAVENYDIAAIRCSTSCGATLLYYTAHPIERDIEPLGILEFEEGTITFDSWQPSFRAKRANGSVVDYSCVAPGDRMQKLIDAIDAVRQEDRPICGAAADFAHIQAVRMSQQLPVLPVRDTLRSSFIEGNDEFVKIDGIEPLFTACLKGHALPKELGKGLD